MRSLRRFILWATFVAFCFLAVMSVVGAFVGAQDASRAEALFMSPPMALFWFILAALLMVGMLSFRRLLRSPGLLGMHLGFLLVIFGAAYASDAGHRWANANRAVDRVPDGYMLIMEGQASNAVTDNTMRNQVGRLPFSIYLEDFWLEHYPPKKGQQWGLLLEFPAPAHEGEQEDMTLHRHPLPWEEGETATQQEAGVTVEVLRYLEHARPVSSGRAQLRVSTPAGEEKTLPPEEGAQVTLQEPPATVTVTQMFSNLRVQGTGAEREVVDVPGPVRNPAAKVRIEREDGTVAETYVMPQMPMHGSGDLEMTLAYETPTVTGAEPADSGPPAMEVIVGRGEDTTRGWLIAREGARFARLPLDDLFQGVASGQPAHGMGTASLYMVRPMTPIKDYKSQLQVLEDGEPVADKTIEVNDPLHYGGYHFYQHSYDDKRGRYTVLSVTSDQGLNLAYVGFLLIGIGAFWALWVQPAVRYFSGRRAEREQRSTGESATETDGESTGGTPPEPAEKAPEEGARQAEEGTD